MSDRLVYALRSGDFIKFGMAGDLNRRITEIQVNSPVKIKKLATTEHRPLKQAAAIEWAIHRALLEYNERGEWFASSPKVLSVVGLMKSQTFERLFEIVTAWHAENLSAILRKGISEERPQVIARRA